MSVIEKFGTMEYGPAPEDAKESLLWLDASKRRFGHFIAGEWRSPLEGKYFETTDPSTGEKLADVSQGSAADVDAAVQSARAGVLCWQKNVGQQRATYPYALARLGEKHCR